MQIQFFCPRWGSEHISWEQWLPLVKEAGYNGIEWGIANDTSRHEIQKVFALAGEYELLVIAQHYETSTASFRQHYDEFSQWFSKLEGCRLLKINSQTGKDFFSTVKNQKLIRLATLHENRLGIPVVHETHRGKFPFAAHIIKGYFKIIANLRITLDVSHWVNVAESLLYDQEEAMSLAISRTDHIHARIGFPQGPQVTDPRAEKWKEAVDRHLGWWDAVVQCKREQGQNCTITPEFGPFPYMVHDPGTEQPLVDQWEINIYMMNFLRERYAKEQLSVELEKSDAQ